MYKGQKRVIMNNFFTQDIVKEEEAKTQKPKYFEEAKVQSLEDLDDDSDGYKLNEMNRIDKKTFIRKLFRVKSILRCRS